MTRFNEPSEAPMAGVTGDIERVYQDLGLTELHAAQYFAGLRALTAASETPPDFVLSHNSFPIETK